MRWIICSPKLFFQSTQIKKSSLNISYQVQQQIFNADLNSTTTLLICFPLNFPFIICSYSSFQWEWRSIAYEGTSKASELLKVSFYVSKQKLTLSSLVCLYAFLFKIPMPGSGCKEKTPRNTCLIFPYKNCFSKSAQPYNPVQIEANSVWWTEVY